MAKGVSNICRAEMAANVPEERPGVPWRPKGGEFVVLSHVSDNFDGAIADEWLAPAGPVAAPSDNVPTLADTSVLAFLQTALDAGTSQQELDDGLVSPIPDPIAVVRALVQSRTSRDAFLERVRFLASQPVPDEAGGAAG